MNPPPPGDPALDTLLEPLLGDLPPEVRATVARWIRLARADSPRAVEAEIVPEAQRLAERFRLAAATVEKMIAG
jgi:hypothetical protein